MSSSARSFGSLAHYLATGRSGDEPERVAWSASRNLPTDHPELAGKIMRATASQNVRVTQPVYHLALSFDPQDAVDRTVMERVADRVIERLHLQGHQVVIVCHRDRGHPHMHLLINRVHPETGRVWNRWQDRAVIQKVLREEEMALGLRSVAGRLKGSDRGQQEFELGDRPVPLNASRPSEERIQPRQTERVPPPASQSKTQQLTKHLQSYEQVVDLTRQQYGAQMEVAAAHVRRAQLEELVERGERRQLQFERALADVYREPSGARQRFVAMAHTAGREVALQTLRERPEELGALITVQRPRAFGIISTDDDSHARTAAIRAAAKAQASLETAETIHQISIIPWQGSERDPRSPGTTPNLRTWSPEGQEIIEANLAVSRKDHERAVSRESAIRRELERVPRREQLETKIIDLLDRMSPKEVRQLRLVLTAPQVALTLKLKTAVRDTVLGRDERQQ
jgi:hypothetical protein